ncbi:MAG: hypothetical protein ACK58T_11875, partial [Phycisphaerae bacterium]
MTQSLRSHFKNATGTLAVAEFAGKHRVHREPVPVLNPPGRSFCELYTAAGSVSPGNDHLPRVVHRMKVHRVIGELNCIMFLEPLLNTGERFSGIRGFDEMSFSEDMLPDFAFFSDNATGFQH